MNVTRGLLQPRWSWRSRLSPTLVVLVVLVLCWDVDALFADTTSLSGATEITSLPCTINAPGVYYLRQNFALNTTDGDGVTVQADGVTIDFNGHTISNLAAGSGVYGTGIRCNGHARLTLRNGTIRGFAFGASIYSSDPSFTSSGHLVENMRFLNCTRDGVTLSSNGSVVRYCQAAKIGGFTAQPINAHGFSVYGDNNSVQDCDIGDLLTNGNAVPVGIAINGNGATVLNNRISGTYYGIRFADGSSGKYRDNLCAASVSTPYTGGMDVGNN